MTSLNTCSPFQLGQRYVILLTPPTHYLNLLTAVDTLRRRAKFDASQDELARHLEAQWSSLQKTNVEARSNKEDHLKDGLGDALGVDRLRLIFTCCHPSLAPEARVALTLREVCGLTTEEIARGFLITPRTLAQGHWPPLQQQFKAPHVTFLLSLLALLDQSSGNTSKDIDELECSINLSKAVNPCAPYIPE